MTLTNMVMVTDEATGNVLVLDRVKRYPGISFPGGHVENGESIYDSAVREVKEETGYDIWNLSFCGFIHWDEPEGKYFTYFYKTTDFTGEPVGETCEGKVFWVDPHDLAHMNLAPNVEKYLKIYRSERCLECYCKSDGRGQYKVIYR